MSTNENIPNRPPVLEAAKSPVTFLAYQRGYVEGTPEFDRFKASYEAVQAEKLEKRLKKIRRLTKKVLKAIAASPEK